MAGNHNSGRKTWDKEIQLRELWELSIPVLKHALKSNELPFQKKVDIAAMLVTKMTPVNTKVEGSLDLKIQPINYGDIKPV